MYWFVGSINGRSHLVLNLSNLFGSTWFKNVFQYAICLIEEPSVHEEKASLHVFSFPWPHQETKISMPTCLTYKDAASRGRRSSCINLVTLAERGCKIVATNTNQITTTSSPRNSDENLASMEDVRSWLEGFVASDKCLFGMDISWWPRAWRQG